MDDARINEEAESEQVTSDVEAGVRTLLADAAQVVPGTDLLIINATDGSIDREMADAIERGARALGARPHVLWTDKVLDVEDVAPMVRAAFETADATIFNHRISSMLRLMPLKGGHLVSNFFTGTEGIGSAAARMPMEYWRTLLRQVQDRINGARSWHIVCADGTDLRGTIPENAAGKKATATGQTFSTVSFPIGIFKPLPTADATGTIALRWFATSGIHFDGPGSLSLNSAVLASVKNGRFTDFDGDPKEVETVTDFLQEAGRLRGKDGYLMNGWHAGINAQVRPNHSLTEGVEKWLRIGHQSPRVVHFHVVGTEPPGEYSAACLDPTITFDDEVMWRDGRLVFAENAEVRDAIAPYGDPDLATSYQPEIRV